MKKVHGSYRNIVLMGIFFGGLFWDIYSKPHGPHSWIGIPLACFYLLAIYFTVVRPQWAYDEKGIETTPLGLFQGKTYEWNRVVSLYKTRGTIFRPPEFYNFRVTIELDNGQKLMISGTKDYSRVLMEVVGYVQAHGPRTKIQPWIFEELKRLGDSNLS